MSKKVEFHPEAAAEVDEALEWYDERDERVAKRFSVALQGAFDLLRERSAMFAPYLLGTRRCLVQGFPYSVIYRDRAQQVDVVAVAHAKREPAYLRKRLNK